MVTLRHAAIFAIECAVVIAVLMLAAYAAPPVTDPALRGPCIRADVIIPGLTERGIVATPLSAKTAMVLDFALHRAHPHATNHITHAWVLSRDGSPKLMLSMSDDEGCMAGTFPVTVDGLVKLSRIVANFK